VGQYKGQLYLILAASIWGGLYVVSKVVLEVVPPLVLVWLRYLIALITLGLLGAVLRQSWQLQKRHLPLVAAIGVIGYFLSIWAQFVGTKLSSAQMGAVITSATPAFMALFARILLKEAITLRKMVAVCLATIGVLLVVGIGVVDATTQRGGLMLVVAALTWALMSVLIKLVPSHYSQLVVTTYAMLAAATVMTPLALAEFRPDAGQWLVQPKIWGGVLYIGVVATAGAFYFWTKGLQLVDATQAGLYFFFQPLVGTILGWLCLGEQVGFSFWLGTLLIIGSVLLVIKTDACNDVTCPESKAASR